MRFGVDLHLLGGVEGLQYPLFEVTGPKHSPANRVVRAGVTLAVPSAGQRGWHWEPWLFPILPC